MVLGVLKVELFFAHSNSLKEKRKYLRSIKEKVRNSLNVAVGETDYQDLWQRSELSFACISNDTKNAQEVLQDILNILTKHYPEFVVSFSKEFLSL
ncbi:MAG: DUF503 domain-containing protein [Aquificaceae bacterium]|nr:DUF503 domain-containing protein [Aquificaceae bacterium]MDW8237143.1 DUF503 domain-containing protein [Aquificaceae bacterium]